jgi:hypothetical protein
MTALKEKYHQLITDLLNVKRTVGLAAALPRFFRQRLTLQEAEETIKTLLATRERAMAPAIEKGGLKFLSIF